MGLLHVCLVLTSLFILAKPTESCSGTKEFTFYDPVNPDQETCKTCPKCPPGKGLEKQCGSRVRYGTFTGCKPCKYNETYSDKNDTSHCKPCNQCGFKIVLQQCTPWQNRRCADICRSGYYMDTVLDECIKIVSGNETTPRTTAMTTAELNSATVRSFPKSNLTSRSTGTTAPTQSLKSTSPAVVYNTHTSTNYTLTEDASARIESSPSPDQDSKDLKGTKITAGSIGGIVCGVVLPTVLIIICIAFKLKRSTCKTRSRSFVGDDSSAEKIQMKESSTMDGPAKKYHNAEDKIRTPLLKDQSNANSTASSSENLHDNLPNGVSTLNIDVQRIPQDIRISAMDKLWDHDGHLMLFYVQDVLDVNETVSVKTWFSVGLALKATRQEMNKIELQCCQTHGSPTQSLLQFFCTKGEAEPTMRDFVKALIECKRYEAARDICNWPYDLSGFTTGAMPGSRLGETRPQSITG